MTEMLFSQKSANLKSVYDSIIALDTDTKEEVLTTFFENNKNHPDQLGLSLCYHEYSKKVFRKNNTAAIRYVKQAVAIRSKYQDTSAMSKSLYALGYYYNIQGNYAKSIQTYSKIIEFGKYDNLTAKSHNRLGIMYSKIGDFDNAKVNFTRAEKYFKHHKNNKLLFKNYVDISQTFIKMNLYHEDKIIYYLQQADSLSKTTKTSKLEKMIVNQIIGNVYDERREYTKAINYYKKALKISENMEDSSYIAMNYNNLGVVYKNSEEDTNALLHYNKALQYKGNILRSKAPVYNNLGDYYIEKQKYKKALDYYHKAIVYTLEEKKNSTYTTLPDIEHLTISPYKLDVLGYLTDKANAWITYYEYEAQEKYLEYALETFKVADQLVDIIRFESAEFQSKLFWRAQSASLYMKAVHVCYLVNKPEEAFYFMEKNKALLLLEDRTQEKAKEDANLPEMVSEREFELRRAIHLAEEQLNGTIATEKTKIDSIKDIVYEQKRTYEKFIDSLETGYPKYYQYKRKLEVLSYNASETFLKENNQIAIYYILNSAEGYGLTVANDSPQLFKITNVPTLHDNIKRLQKKLSAPLYTKEEVEDYQKVAYAIYTTIFPPLKQTALANKQLLIIPDGNLQQIPFEVLMSSPTHKNSYLLSQCAISYANSLSFLKLNASLSRNPQHEFIGFAPIQFTDTTLVPLPRSSDEIREVGVLFSGDFYEESQASKRNFIEQVSNYKIIHLSTHADVGDGKHPWISFYDDKLSLEELYATKNQADLVVLSACKTSQGELKTGEGVMSLARGFFNTGTQSVVSTLWNANEKSTQEILTSFYQNLKKGEPKTIALQHAKQVYLQKHKGIEASPFYWGAPILIGHTNQIIVPNKTPIYLIIGIGILFLIVMGWFFYRKNLNR